MIYPSNRPCVLIILDGWGIGPETHYNAVSIARTPFLDRILKTYPHTRLVCSGEAVGLPPGIMGNSEVGHLNIGAGRVVLQDLLRINHAIEDGSFFKNGPLKQIMTRVKSANSRLHLIGLLSDGGVHSDIKHLWALLKMARENGLAETVIHAILDGRDTPPKSGIDFIEQLQQHLDETGYGAIASICGRYYAMDRDTHWDRIEKAYRLYAGGRGQTAGDPLEAVAEAYRRGESDEFVTPVVITGADTAPLAKVEDGDGIVFFNFRADRARELTRAFTDTDFSFFERRPHPRLCGYVCMTHYDDDFDLPIAFEPGLLKGILGEVISRCGLRQLRIAETEKYAHVTYFFNGGEESPFPGEDRCLVPSPRDIPTYDHKPQMSALPVTEKLLSRLAADTYDFIVLNFANMDMVGHTGDLDAAVTACETVDTCLKRIVEKVLAIGGVTLVTADHGNSEKMLDAQGQPHTAHTLNPVRLIVVGRSPDKIRLKEGVLGDIAPTILALMNIEKPPQMTGKSLIVNKTGRS